MTSVGRASRAHRAKTELVPRREVPAAARAADSRQMWSDEIEVPFDQVLELAEVYAWRGENDSAFTWLERARVEADAGIFWIKTDPLLRKIRGDPRYTAFLKKMNLPVD